jgi:hypothetical protein
VNSFLKRSTASKDSPASVPWMKFLERLCVPYKHFALKPKPWIYKSNSIAVSGVEQQIKVLPDAGRSSGSGV